MTTQTLINQKLYLHTFPSSQFPFCALFKKKQLTVLKYQQKDSPVVWLACIRCPPFVSVSFIDTVCETMRFVACD